MKKRISSIYHLLAILILGIAGCDTKELDFRGNDKESAIGGFNGIQSINITPDGRYILVWEHVKGLSDIGNVSYEIYLEKWTEIPEEVSAQKGSSPLTSGEGTPLGARFTELPDAKAPVGKGILLASVKGSRSYNIEEKLQPQTIYAFQVRSVGADGTRDSNTKVLIYSADFNKLSFDGVSGLTVSSTGSLILSWSPPSDLSNAQPNEISYDVYMTKSLESIETIKNVPGTIAITSSLHLSTNSNVGTLLELPKDRLPSSTAAVFASLKGGQFYEIETDIKAGMTYLFQVQARGPGGEIGESKRVYAYERPVFSFAGLKDEAVTLASDYSKISLSWDTATGNTGTVTYIIYSDANFTSILSSTTTTSYEFLNPTKGQSYIFGVRAKDGSITDSNQNFVIVSVPDPSDKTPPVFTGLKTAETVSDKKILLKWDASPSTDIALYNIYFAHNPNSAIASTAANYFMVTGLSAATSYNFIVRAADTSNNEEKNNIQKSANTLAYSVPDFAGASAVNRAGGLDGLSKLTVTWSPAGGQVTGYKVYKATSSGGFNFNSPDLTLANPNTTSAAFNGLDSGTTYYFVVRAYENSSGTDREDLNTVEKSQSTLTIQAPTFSGAASATAGEGSLGLTTVKVTWPAPQTDGIYDSFVVDYELGTCATTFSATPSSVTVNGDAVREYTIGGLTQEQTYRFRVRARYSTTDLTDSNTTCKQATTTPPNPIFSGVGSVSLAAGIQGFDSLDVTWPAATSSFSYYKVEWSTASTFATIGGDEQINNIATLSTTLTGLPTKTTIYVRVTATFDEGGVLLKSGQSKILNKKTEPASPTGEGVASVAVMSADTLKVSWTSPTNALSAVFNGYKLWSYCGTSAASNLLTKVSNDPADQTYGTGQLEATFSSLTSNTECCYQVRAFYDDSTNTLSSQSTIPHKCNTPTLTAPTFAGITSLTNSNQANGFTRLTANWSAVAAGQAGLFSYYEIDWATTSNGHDWAGTIQITDRTQTSVDITGLTENTTYYVRIRAVNANGSPVVFNGQNAVQNATTTPKIPTGDNLATATSLSATKAQITYTPPNSNVSTGGLFNNVFLFIQAGTASDASTYRTSVETGGVADGEIAAVMTSGKVTLSSVPAVVRIPPSEITADTTNTFEIWGLTVNTQVCAQAAAVYWVNGQTTRYLKSTTPSTKCVTPTAGPPTFAGVSSLTGYEDAGDFTQIIVGWGSITGDCTGVEISAQTSPTSPDFNTPYATAACGDSSATIGGLAPHTEYYIQVRAVNEVSGTKYTAGSGQELSKVTYPPIPSGDGLSNATATSIPKANDKIDLTYVEATSGFWNKTYIWKSAAATQGAAETAVRAAAATKPDKSGPTSAPYAILNPSNTTYSDTSATAGLYSCYISRSVHTDGTYYKASANDTVQCARPAYTTPTFAGVASGKVIGSWPNGAAKVELTFVSAPLGSIEEYEVFFSESNSFGSFDLNSPVATIDKGDATYDANPNDTKILVNPAVASLKDGYFLVRYKFFGGPDSDSNQAVSSRVQILEGADGYALIPKSISGLGYDYYIMRYEASWAGGGSAPGGDTVTTTEADLATCAYQLHTNAAAAHSSCGTKAITKVPQSVEGVSPATDVTWPEAFYGCRNASNGNVIVRLPTYEEWQRASKWLGSSYTTMWNVYSNNAAGHCYVDGMNPTDTGSESECVSRFGVHDMMGNVSEWVDARMVRYDISSAGESRFSYGPVIGRTIRNGLHNISRRFHAIDPGANGLAMAMGANYSAASPTDQKQFGDRQIWLPPSTAVATVGFRCVAFNSTVNAPTMADMAIPEEPTYVAADIGGAASTWKIPENLYIKDTRPEEVAITVNGNTADTVAEGKVNISWKPWQKTVCTPSCTSSDSGISYNIYRFIEPTKAAIRLTTPWALTGGSNPYDNDKPLDPLATDASGNRIYTSSTNDGKLIASISNCDSSTPANCTFEDSISAGTGFSTRKIYNYIMVAEDSSGNHSLASVQRFRSPYFAGTAVPGAATFKLEPRFRRAAVFLVDEEHQQAQTRPQIMVHVPMDKSGLDHDFFVQKYEASSYNGSVSNNSPAGSSNWPLQADAVGTWSASAAKCHDLFLQNLSFDVTACGNGSVVNGTSTTVQSKQGTNPLVSIDQGAFWKACRNTSITDDAGNPYYLALLSDPEWLKAADWGDVDLNGTIDQSVYTANLGLTIDGTVEYSSGADNTTIRCHSDNNPASALVSNSSGSGSTANCRSRYGAADMVGNVWEWTTGQHYTGVGYDNGVDGLWLAQNFPTSSNTIAAHGGKYDLLRGLPKASGASTITTNQDYYWYNSTLRGALRGGDWFYTVYAGRWALAVDSAPSNVLTSIGGRCAR